MTEFTMSLHCPKCNHGMTVLPLDACLGKPFACPGCGANINPWDLKTPSGNTLSEYDPDVLRRNLKGKDSEPLH